MVDFAYARRTMVDSQLRTFDVNDIALLDAMGTIQRERFVLPGREQLAYIDQNIAVSEGAQPRFMLAPAVQARMIQALEIEPGMAVLDVACGRGYSSAVLAEVGANVTALEADEALAEAAKHALAAQGVAGVTVKAGPLDKGWAENAPYAAILVNGSVNLRPDALLSQLADGGRLVCIEGDGRSARTMLHVRTGDAFGSRQLFDAAAPVIPAFQPKPAFVF
ncbi:protein-L-isoaspartate O-methyltransferase family protein [Microvirga pudoricolor]|uniref:protein-L-isoaspartate O-methyltransferase family protein n=1 Tax=Microvirga pudoricolor TaxID=2778729 RepID=UPI0019516933|nr:protein-L-isoaspartate O-methyltransferase [Microvirga pudoricolor]MBM6594219.1 protein-L-isoaspartate O-methyltransferase [Microvirga pudoricolor]